MYTKITIRNRVDEFPANIACVMMEQLTQSAIQQEPEKVVLQAIEIWSALAEVEKNRLYNIQAAQNRGCQLTINVYGVAAKVLPHLLPMILACLTTQNEDFRDDNWNRAMAAGTCLSLLAQAARDNILQPVLRFVEMNINNSNWRFREAAVLAFGTYFVF